MRRLGGCEPPERLGYRGAILLGFAGIWITLGLRVPYDDPTGGYANTGLVHLLIPTDIRVALWVGFGIATAIAAFGSNRSWDRAGFLLLLAMPFERSASFAWAFITWIGSGGRLGYPAAILDAIIWLFIVFVILVTARWPEAVKVRRLDVDG